jgi:hypothetical protein
MFPCFMARPDRGEEPAAAPYTDAVVLVALGLALIGTLLLDAAVVRGGESAAVRDGRDLGPVVVCVTAAACACLISAIGSARRSARRTEAGTVILAAATAGFLLIAMAIEALGLIVPDDFVGVTSRRIAADTGAGAGLWVGGALSGLAATVSRWGTRSVLARAGRQATARGAAVPLYALGMLAAAGASLALRYEPWLTVGARGSDASLDAWALPFAAPATLIAAWGLGLAAALLLLGRTPTIGALVGAASGWLCTFAAAMMLIAERSASAVRPTVLTSIGLDGDTVRVDALAAPTLTYAAGLVAAGIAASVLITTPAFGLAS